MRILLFSLLLSIVWMIVIGEFSPLSLVIGFVISYMLVALAWGGLDRFRYFRRTWKFVDFVVYFIKELVVANLRIAYYTLSPLSKLRPGILAIELDQGMTDLEITTLGTLITLTPGTLTIDVSDDRTVMFVHFIHLGEPEEMKREIREVFARRLLEVMR